MTAIGLLSDVHATPGPVAEALEIFRSEGVDHVFCAGDIAGYHDGLDATVQLLSEAGSISILGNHDQGYLQKHADDGSATALAYFAGLPAFIDTTIDGRHVYMVHAEPPAACHGGIKLRDKSGEVQPDRVAHWEKELAGFAPDVLIVGHTHQVYAEQVGNTLVVNPGSSVFNYSCAVLRLPEMRVETFPLSGRAISVNWNWSDHFGKDR